MATMEDVVRRIVREEVNAALADAAFTVTILGEEVELHARAGKSVATGATQGQRRSTGSNDRAPAASPAAAGSAPATREVPSPITDQFLEHEVAAIYRQAVADGDRPNKKLQETFGRSRSAVSQWLRACREKGFLPETQPGRVSTFDDAVPPTEREG